MKFDDNFVMVDPPSEINLNLPNLDLAYSATILQSRVIDFHAFPQPYKRFFRREWPCVLLSRRSFNKESADKLAEVYSEKFPNCKIIGIRGPIDVQCCYPFLRLPSDMRIEIEFGDQLPFPEYQRFDSYNYLQSNWSSGWWGYPIMTSLGCPFSCTFCHARQRKWKGRSVEHVVEELRKAVLDYQIISFEILDDVFNLHEERTIEFCKKIEPMKLSWSCVNGIRADRFTERQAAAMWRAGCVQVGFGIESVDNDVLAQVKKGESFEAIERAVNIAYKYFDRVAGFFIIGLPGSSFEKDMKSLSWARDRGLRAYFSYYVSPTQALEGKPFYGTTSTPESSAYPLTDQAKVYREAKILNGHTYAKERFLWRTLLATWHSRNNYTFRSWLNHAWHMLSRSLSFLLRSELQ